MFHSVAASMNMDGIVIGNSGLSYFSQGEILMAAFWQNWMTVYF